MVARKGHELSFLTPASCRRAGRMPLELCLLPESQPGEARGRIRRERACLSSPRPADVCLGHSIRGKISQAGPTGPHALQRMPDPSQGRPLGHEAYSLHWFSFPLTHCRFRVMSPPLFWANFPSRAGDIGSFSQHLLHTLMCQAPSPWALRPKASEVNRLCPLSSGAPRL